jgi:serine/threonine-protein kinase Chk2
MLLTKAKLTQVPKKDRIVGSPTVSNRHCLLFPENTSGITTAVLEDLSGNGTYVNDQLVGRNKRRELQDGDEISILDEARFSFRYPRNRDTNGFRQRYSMQQQLGKGHFASVYLCVEKNTGMRYAVKKFEKRAGPGERSKVEGLQQEIAVLMGVSHPSLLCLKDTFDEDDGVYLVLELAPEGELFNFIVMKQKLTETEARKVFVQLFQAVKYLACACGSPHRTTLTCMQHERSIVHRDIKPENILLYDKKLTVKLADFGLAKIIGEESFTTTLCGTPSYVAPEILQSSNHRRYTRAVDVWSLGVVLYICLCGFPPFSDELYDPVNNPYTLAQQILGGRFDYPSPYWDSVGDPALDLIDRMLTVDPDKRISIDGCLEHPWTTGREIPATQLYNSMDSTDGLVGQLTQLDFSRRKPVRERTLLSEINDITVTRVIDAIEDTEGNSQAPIKVFEKNKGGHAGPSLMPTNGLDTSAGAETLTKKTKKGIKAVRKEETPAGHRDPADFMALGGKGDQVLFGDDENSNEKAKDAQAVGAATNGKKAKKGKR